MPIFFKDHKDIANHWEKDYQITLKKNDKYKINLYIKIWKLSSKSLWDKKKLDEKLNINKINIDNFNTNVKIKLYSQRYEYYKNLLNKINSESVNKWKK